MEIFIIIVLLVIAVETTYLIVSGNRKNGRMLQSPVFVDTSVLIDGRIVAIAESGFISRSLYIPRSVVGELQFLADNADTEKRGRARHGLDVISLLQAIKTVVLERRTKLNLSDKDIYINVVGGLKLNDQAADLAICMAIASAAAGRRIDDDTVVFGEVGLGGEVRSVIGTDKRVAEAKKLGFKRAITPKQSQKNAFITPVGDIRTALIDYLQK